MSKTKKKASSKQEKTQKKLRQTSLIFKIIALVIFVIIAQLIAGYMSAFIAERGTWNALEFFMIFDFIKANPLSFFSFNPTVYFASYGMMFMLYIYFYYRMSRQTPVADMKYEEHGSNDFMDEDELEEYVRERVTKDFPYSADVRKDATY